MEIPKYMELVRAYKMSKVKVCSYITSNISPDNYKIWENSLKKLGYDYNIIGRDQTWTGVRDWSMRTKSYISYLKSQPGNGVYIFTDSTDVFFIASPDELYNKFLELSQKLNTRVIIGGEPLNFFPFPERYLLEQYFTERATGRFRYPNGGLLIGYKDDLLAQMEKIKDEKCDQTAYAIGMYKGTVQMEVDTEGYIFANVPELGKFTPYEYSFWTIKDKRLYGATGNQPCVVHTPGHKVYSKLSEWYNIIFDDNINNTCNPNNYNYLIPILILIILVMILFFLRVSRQQQ